MRNIDPNGSGNGAPAMEDDPVVVCGMAMRLPGGVSNSQEFWDMLVGKRCGSVPVPESRFNAKGYYSEEKRPGTIQLKRAYFMDHVTLDRFDASHFPFSRKEVERMDPVQRMLLEITWECLENAGETDYQGKNVGCYVGSFMEDWAAEMERDTQHFTTYPAGGWDIMLSNRISYAYDFHGPSMTVKTGCSATLVALNLAEQAVKSGECSSAIIAGCNIFLSATSATKASYATLGTILSAEGICKTFDADCDGYGRGEAINAIYIKKLSHAIRDGNPIRAIIRSTATQHDGKKPGLLNPNTHAQEALIRHTYRIAGITDFSETAFFECHGTGTVTGDPTEVSAVERIFGEKGVLIGGVKPNTGHSEGAAALTSIIKVILMLERGIIAPNINFHNPNPAIPWAGGRIKVPTEAQPFPLDRLKRVSVNAFGIGGTNAHAILEAYQSNAKPRTANLSPPAGSHLLLFSASNPKSLEMLQEAYKQYFNEKLPDMMDLAYTLGCQRTKLSHRSFAVIRDGSYLTEPVHYDSAVHLKTRKTIFIFNGQGAQWPTMGKSLLNSNSTFLNTIRRLDEALRHLPEPPSWSIEDELKRDRDESRVMKSEYSLPCSTAVQIGITEVLRSWSIRPDAVSGHSSGEIAGAFAAGALTAEEAIIVAYFRGRIPATMGTEHRGTMAAIGLGSKEVAKYLIPGVSIACENSQVSTTISGDTAAVEELVEKFKADGVFARLLTVDRAYHSPYMRAYGPAYEDAIRPFIRARAPEAPFFSSVTENRVTDANSLGAEYWHQSLVQPVRFNSALMGMLQTYGQHTNPVIVEIGARPALKGPIKQILDDFPSITACHVPTLEQNEDCNESMMKAAGRFFCENINFDYKAVTPPGKTLIDLPTYTWAHDESFQEEHRLFKAYRDCQFPMHDLLGRQVFETSALDPTWRKVLQVDYLPWLGDHMINGQIIFPFAAYLSIAEEALRQVSGGVLESFSAKDFKVFAALHLEPGNTVEIHTRLRRLADSSSYAVQVTSWKGDVWTEHCNAVVSAGPFPHRPRRDIQKKVFPRIISPQYWYKSVQDRGFTYGPTFRGLENISVSPSTPQATARVHPMDDPSNYLIHPTAIDQCFQTLVTANCHGQHRKAKYVTMPSSVKEIFVSRSSGAFWTTATSESSAISGLSGSIISYTDSGEEIMSMIGVEGSQVATQASTDELPLLGSAHWWYHSSLYPFHMLSKDKIREDFASSGLTQPSTAGILSHAMSIFTHTNPQLSVLEMGAGTDTVTRRLLALLRPGKGQQLFSKYTYLSLSPETCQQAKEALADIDGIEFGTLDTVDSGYSLELELGSYDLIISNDTLRFSEKIYNAFGRLKDLLRPTGALILLELLQDDGSLSSFKLLPNEPVSENLSGKILPALRAAGFNLIPENKKDPELIPPILQLSAPPITQNICILAPEQATLLVDQFKSDLDSYSVPSHVCFNMQNIPAEETLIFFWDLVTPYIYNLTDAEFRPFIDLLSGHRKPIVWVTPLSQTSCKDPKFAMINGLARTLRSELKTDITVVEVDTEDGDITSLSKGLINIVKHLPLRRFNDGINPDFEFALTRGAVKVPRFHCTTIQEELSRCSLSMAKQSSSRPIPKKPRQLETLQWVNFPLRDVDPSHIRVEVQAASIDKQDADTVKRLVNTSTLLLGCEGAGIIRQVGSDIRDFKVGDRVMFVSHGTLASHIDISPTNCLRLEDNMLYETASSIPLAFANAFLAVVEFGRVRQGATVLLPFVRSHVCLAVMQILKAAQASVYFVVDSEEDGSLLENEFQISRTHILSSHEGLSISRVKETLNQKYADYVLGFGSSQPEILLQCLSTSGTFLDISDSRARDLIPASLRASQAHRIVNIMLLGLEEPELMARALQQCKAYFFAEAQPSWMQLCLTFEADYVREAFQAAAKKDSIENKIILRLPLENQRTTFHMSPSETGLRFRSDASYLLVGGLGGLGQAVATWMVENGARELIFLSRSAGKRSDSSNFLEELRSQGCLVTTVAGSVSNSSDVSKAVKVANSPISGVIQMSMVLRDNAISRMSFEEWKECIDPKIEGTINLHKALLHHHLDFFLLFSSMSGVTGQIGQANYNAANTYLDAFVKYRHQLGLNASVIDIGVMGGIGVVAQTDNMELRAKAAGYHVLGEQDLLDCLTTSILHSQPKSDPTSDRSQVVLGLWSERPLADPSTHVLWKKDARMSPAYSFNNQSGSAQDQLEQNNVEAVVLIAKTAPDRLKDDATIELIVKHVGIAISELLAQPDTEILPTALLDDIGLDSLNAIELTGWIAQYFLVDLPLFDLIHTPTLWDLAVKISDLMYDEFGQADS